MLESDFFVDEKVFVSFFIGDLKTFLVKFQGRLRYLKHSDYEDHNFLIMTYKEYFPFIEDFINWQIDLPEWFIDAKFKPLNYEAVSGDSLYTDPDVYMKLMAYFRKFYNGDKAVEFWCPRGDINLMEVNTNEFINYKIDEIKTEKPLFTIYVSNEIKEKVWRELIEYYSKDHNVVVFNNSDYVIENSITSLSDATIYTKNSVQTITVDNNFAVLPVVLNSKTFFIGTDGSSIITRCRLMKCPGKYKQIPDFKLVTAKEIIDDV